MPSQRSGYGHHTRYRVGTGIRTSESRASNAKSRFLDTPPRDRDWGMTPLSLRTTWSTRPWRLQPPSVEPTRIPSIQSGSRPKETAMSDKQEIAAPAAAPATGTAQPKPTRPGSGNPSPSPPIPRPRRQRQSTEAGALLFLPSTRAGEKESCISNGCLHPMPNTPVAPFLHGSPEVICLKKRQKWTGRTK